MCHVYHMKFCICSNIKERSQLQIGECHLLLLTCRILNVDSIIVESRVVHTRGWEEEN
jgi:hypothetical protein